MITPINYWLRIYEYYIINSINRLVPVGKGEGERCDECGILSYDELKMEDGPIKCIRSGHMSGRS